MSFEEAKAFANRYGMISYQEFSAKNIETIQALDDLFACLAEEMIRNREEHELTQSSLHRSGIISLSDDWEIVEAPEDPIPHTAYSHQDSFIRQRLRLGGGPSRCLC